MSLDQLLAPYSPPNTNLVDRLRYWVKHQPKAVAFYYLVDGDDDEVYLTYEDLDRRARAIAETLASLNLVGQRALMLYPPGLDFIAGFFGCLYAGVVPVPAYPPRRNRNMSRIQAIAEDSDAKAALTVAEVMDRVEGTLDETPGLQQLIWLATDDIPDQFDDNWQMPDIDEQAIALLQYTSGSTGSPKGVVLSHANLTHNCGLITQAFEFSRTGCGMTWLPTYHDMGLLGGVLSPLYFGRPNVLMSPMAFLQKPVRWLRAITRYEVTVSGGPNFAYTLCTEKISPDECEGIDLHTWDVAFNGAEPIRPETLDAFTRRFAPYGFRAETHYPCYGMAETTLIVTGGVKRERPIIQAFDAKALEAHRIVPVQNGQAPSRQLVGCGHVRPDEDVIIVDPDKLVELTPDQVGEIWVRSPSVGQGYWNKPSETERVFQARLNDGDGRTWLRTGDLGFLYEGQLFVTGRIKDLIIVRGVNRYPQDIETTVENVSDRLRTGGSAAIAVEVDGRERLLVACEVDRSRNAEWDQIIDDIRRSVTVEHELPPDAVVLVRAGSIPKTSSGKIQRHACKSSFLNADLLVVAQWIGWDNGKGVTPGAGNERSRSDENSVAVVDPLIAKAVLEHVQSVAKDRAADLGLDSNLVVDLGLDSMERLEIANSLEESFGGRFPDEVLQRVETCREVAVAIEKHLAADSTLLNERIMRRTLPDVSDPAQTPVAHYQFDQFPEYVRLIQTKGMFEAMGARNPYFSIHSGVTADTTVVAGRELINFSSYNYLGMSGDRQVSRAAQQAIDEYGTSVSASRLASGERSIHGDLEREIADFLGTDDALLFVAGHAANETVIGHLFGPGDLILHDQHTHNSIIQGAELSGARRRPFEHNSYSALDELLNEVRHQYRRVLVALDGLYNLEGDFPNLPRFIEVKRRHKALMLIDEGHSLGTLGTCGRGLSEYFGVNPHDVDMWMGSLSKSLGSSGGYIAADRQLVEYLRYTAPGFVYATGIPPANVAAARAALRLLGSEPERVARLQANSRLFVNLAKQRGLNTGNSNHTPVVPIIVGNSLHALQLSACLFDRGINVQPIIHPAVREEKACVRFLVTTLHTEAQIRQSVGTLVEELLKIDPHVVKPKQLTT